MYTVLRSTSVVLVVALFAGCTMAKVSGRGTTPLLLNNPTERVELVEHFKTSKRIVFDHTGSFDVSEVLSRYLQRNDGDAITNLTVTVKSDVGDFFINLFTLGLAASKTVQIEGDLVRRAADGAGSDSPAGVRDGELLAHAGPGEPLMVNVASFAGRPEESPVILRRGDGLVLVAPWR